MDRFCCYLHGPRYISWQEDDLFNTPYAEVFKYRLERLVGPVERERLETYPDDDVSRAEEVIEKLDFILRERIQPQSTVIDFGAAPGTYAEHLHVAGHRAIPVTIHSRMTRDPQQVETYRDVCRKLKVTTSGDGNFFCQDCVLPVLNWTKDQSNVVLLSDVGCPRRDTFDDDMMILNTLMEWKEYVGAVLAVGKMQRFVCQLANDPMAYRKLSLLYERANGRLRVVKPPTSFTDEVYAIIGDQFSTVEEFCEDVSIILIKMKMYRTKLNKKIHNHVLSI